MNGGNSTLLSTTVEAVYLMLSIALLISLVRLVRGPSLPDRVVALDLIAVIAVGVMATYSITAREEVILDAAIVISLIAFLGTVAFASFLERGGRR